MSMLVQLISFGLLATFAIEFCVDAAVVVPQASEEPNETLKLTTNSLKIANEADVDVMKQTLLDLFASARSDDKQKRLVRNHVLKLFQKYGLETHANVFERHGYTGVNLIGVRPGNNYKKGKTESILVVGSHYDSVSRAPGVDDNGSGSVIVLENARLLHLANATLDHTIIFVCFDLEELGLMGSNAFVTDWLIPRKLKNKNSKFLGAYVVDMDLLYDPRPGVQIIPQDVAEACPTEAQSIKEDGFRGDFTVTFMRTGVEDELMNELTKEWKKTAGGKKYKLRKFSADPKSLPGTFSRSDHYSFWASGLKAMLLSDLGPWRGEMVQCYHRSCDDTSLITDQNLHFLKTTIDSIYGVLVNFPSIF